MDKKITRLYTGPDGESHFEDTVLHLECQVGTGRKAESLKATGITVREKGPRQDHDWHNTPYRQFLIVLEGEVEMEVGDGSKRKFGPGDILLSEDTTGQGHITRALGNQSRKAVVVGLE
jgi:quercetin dioxygenase-like cupin family protein